MFKKEQIEEHISALKEYFFVPLKKIFIGEKKIKTLFDLEEFIQTKSAIITQHTLYGYLKTRIGTRHVMLFGDEQFSKSIDIAKWNIYTVSHSRPLPLLLFLSCKQQSMQQYGFSNRCFSPHFRW